MRNGIRVQSAGVAVALAMIFSMLLREGEATGRGELYKPVTYEVGGQDGWDLSVSMQGWARGKNFHSGDRLHFKYDDQRFDVAVVNKAGFDSCTVNDGATVFDSGDDTFQLPFGANYFIDSEGDVCAAGLKMAINATAPPPAL